LKRMAKFGKKGKEARASEEGALVPGRGERCTQLGKEDGKLHSVADPRA